MSLMSTRWRSHPGRIPAALPLLVRMSSRLRNRRSEVRILSGALSDAASVLPARVGAPDAVRSGHKLVRADVACRALRARDAALIVLRAAIDRGGVGRGAARQQRLGLRRSAVVEQRPESRVAGGPVACGA